MVSKTHNLNFNNFLHFINSLINLSNKMNVQLSSKGSRLLNNKELASKVIDRVIIDHKKLDKGENVIVNDDNSKKVITVSIVSSKFDEKTD